MGVTKHDIYSDTQNEFALMAKAFAHPARVAILEYLLSSDQCINSDLVKELGLAQATISQHLKALKETGIIKGSIEGASICYCIDADRWKEFKDQFEKLFNQFDHNKNKC